MEQLMEKGLIDLQAVGIDEAQAADLRARLATFAEDRDSTEMDAYDDYDAAKREAEATSSETNPEAPPRVMGLHAGTIWMSADFTDPLPDEFWLGEK
jgi:hypothetical protein